MADTAASQSAQTSESPFPGVGTYWKYYCASDGSHGDSANVPLAIVQVLGWSYRANRHGHVARRRVSLAIYFAATPAELDPHKVEDLCRLESELQGLSLERFLELVGSRRLVPIRSQSMGAHSAQYFDRPNEPPVLSW